MVLVTKDDSLILQMILVMLYSTGNLVSNSDPPNSSMNIVVTLLRLRFASCIPFTIHSTLTADEDKQL